MKENLGYITKSGIEISDRMVRITMIPKEYFGAKEIKTENCTTYTPTTDTSDRCLICGKLKWEHSERV